MIEPLIVPLCWPSASVGFAVSRFHDAAVERGLFPEHSPEHAHLVTEHRAAEPAIERTAEDAFVATGSKFFSVESITDAMRVAKKIPFHTFRYKLGMKFDERLLENKKEA